VLDASGANLNKIRRARVSATVEAPAEFAWSPAYSVVAGVLPESDQPLFTVWNQSEPQSVVRFRLDTTTAGPVKLLFESAAGLTLYVGKTGVEAKPETIIDLPQGPTVVTLVIDRKKRSGPLRVELADVPGSPARAAIVGGR
jgi:hypothetical protein